jgi:hypothetical protein
MQVHARMQHLKRDKPIRLPNALHPEVLLPCNRHFPDRTPEQLMLLWAPLQKASPSVMWSRFQRWSTVTVST